MRAVSSQLLCKPLPGGADWPSDDQWQALNRSISGRLLAPFAFGAVCHPGSASYDNASCAALDTQWTASSWQESNAWTSMYNDDTCVPVANTSCSTAGYPAYVVVARSTADVQAGVEFAHDTGVRLIVKGTGHDEPGRSAGAGSLSIWTHHLTGLDIDRHDPSAGHEGVAASVRLGAGVIWGDVYKDMAKANLTVVGGSDPHVGVGGWVQGGGHGPLSARYGLGADQVIEMEVVTADGVHRVINATSYPDLFWAMRGGGPSTYAVMLSMTIKAYPTLPGIQHTFQYNTTTASDTFWTLVANFSSRLPALNRKGAMGYFYVVPDSGSVNRSVNAVLQGILIFPNRTKGEVDALMQPLEASLKSPFWAKDAISIGSKTGTFANFMEYWSTNTLPESVGVDTRYAAWLLDEAALTRNTSEFARTFHEITPSPWMWVGHLVAGVGVAEAKPAGGSDAVLPAWRKAFVHLVHPRTWTPHNVTEKQRQTKALRDQVQPALRSLAPESGAYVNEGDPSDPEWKKDYYGANYERLLEIKRKWDPKGVFWCKPCVGFDEWKIIPLFDHAENPNDRGIGQDQVKLCRSRRDW